MIKLAVKYSNLFFKRLLPILHCNWYVALFIDFISSVSYFTVKRIVFQLFVQEILCSCTFTCLLRLKEAIPIKSWLLYGIIVQKFRLEQLGYLDLLIFIPFSRLNQIFSTNYKKHLPCSRKLTFNLINAILNLAR